MVELKPLDVLGFPPDFFRLADEGNQPFTYYTFATSTIHRGYWEIIGVRYLEPHTSGVELRLMHIDEEMLDWTDFTAQRDTPGFITFDLPEMTALLAFLQNVLSHLPSSSPPHQNIVSRHLEVLTSAELEALQVPTAFIRFLRLVGQTYQLLPERGMPPERSIRLVILPHWTEPGGEGEGASLRFVTFDTENLSDPTFNPVDANGLGVMRFDQRAFREFIELLGQRLPHPSA